VAESTARPPDPERLWVVESKTYAYAIGWMVAALVTAQVIKKGLRIPAVGTIIEAAVLLSYVLILFSLVPVRRWFSALPRPHRLFIVGFFFLAVTGQLTTDNRKTFPFPAWTMYGKQESPDRLEYYRYHGVNANGHDVNVDPADVLGFVNVAEIASRVRFIARDARLPESDPKRAIAQKKLHDLLVTIGRAYELKHPDVPLRSLEFLWYSWDYHNRPANAVVPEPMLKIEFPPEGGAR
jgi:hypothetical protein